MVGRSREMEINLPSFLKRSRLSGSRKQETQDPKISRARDGGEESEDGTIPSELQETFA